MLEETTPGVEVREYLQGVGRLTAEQAARRVLVVHSKQQSVFPLVVMGNNVWLVLQCLGQHLPQRGGIEPFHVIPVQEKEFTLWVHFLPPEHLLALMQYESTSGLALRHGRERDQSGDVRFSLRLSEAGSLGHFLALVDAGHLGALQSRVLTHGYGFSTHEPVRLGNHTDSVMFIEETLIGSAVLG